MWITHLLLPALTLKPLFPSVPLGTLSLAGAFPDILYYALGSIPTSIHDNKSTNVLNFLTSHRLEWSHSPYGTLALAAILSVPAALTMSGKQRGSVQMAKTGLATMLAVGSHYFLDYVAHKPESVSKVFVKSTNRDQALPTASLYASPTKLFLTDSALALLPLAATIYYNRRRIISQLQKRNIMLLSTLLLLSQAGFCFHGVAGDWWNAGEKTDEYLGEYATVRSPGRGWVHSLYHLMQLLGFSIGIGRVLESVVPGYAGGSVGSVQELAEKREQQLSHGRGMRGNATDEKVGLHLDGPADVNPHYSAPGHVDARQLVNDLADERERQLRSGIPVASTIGSSPREGMEGMEEVKPLAPLGAWPSPGRNPATTGPEGRGRRSQSGGSASGGTRKAYIH